MQKRKNAEMIMSRSCDAENKEVESRCHDQFLSWGVAKGTSMSTKNAKIQK